MSVNVVTILTIAALLLIHALYTRWLIKWHRRMVYLDVMEFLIRQGREDAPEPPPIPPSKPSNRDHLRIVS